MLHESITAEYEPQKKLFRRLINLAFTFAGVYWIFIYAVRFASVVSDEDVAVFRAGQTLPYFILLTLWGLEYLRESKRLQAVITVANEKGIAPGMVTANQLGNDLAKFSILRVSSNRSWLMVTLNYLGFLAGYYLLLQQYLALLGLFIVL